MINKQKSRRKLHNGRRRKYRKQFARTFRNRVRKLARHCSAHPNDGVAIAAFSRTRSRPAFAAPLRLRPALVPSTPRSANDQVLAAYRRAA